MTRLTRRCSLALALCSVLIAGASYAATTGTESQILHTLQQRFPQVPIDAVLPSPVPGLYEVISGDRMLYVDASGDHLLLGNMIDTRTKEDLTQDAMDMRYSIKFDSLPFNEAITIVRGNGARKLALFEDPDCPFCQQLEHNMSSMNDVTIYLFLFPIPQVHPHALVDAQAIWCAPDRGSAWTNWMMYHTPIPHGGSCADDPIARINTLAQSLHIAATPTIFLQNGRRIGGAVTLDKLQRLMAKASTAPLAASQPSPN
jgi:thiol:disulfide interchange protein DsbC